MAAPFFLVFGGDRARGFTVLGEFGDGVDERAAAEIARGEAGLQLVEQVQHLSRRRCVRHRQRSDAPAQVGGDKHLFRWKRIVQRALADPGLGGDSIDPDRPDPLLIEQPIGCGQDAVGHGGAMGRAAFHADQSFGWR